MMTKKTRQQLVLDIVTQKKVYTFYDILRELEKRRCKVNVSTLCRDIAELKVVKTVEGYRMLKDATGAPEVLPSQVATLQQMITGIKVVKNLIIVHTITGGAPAVARLFDITVDTGLVGTIAGDDTILCITSGDKDAKKFFEWLSRTMERK
jgi:transcriptional regulator of arginine metabolism